MGRSSRILSIFMVSLLPSAVATPHAVAAALTRPPSARMPLDGPAASTKVHHAGATGSAVHRMSDARVGRFKGGDGFDTYGAAGIGFATLGLAATLPPADGGGSLPPVPFRPPFVIPAPRAACPRPLVIEVGQGPRQTTTTTRVVYGAPPCGF